MKTLQERFDEKWTPEPNTGCWVWFGYFNNEGYGKISVGGRRGRLVRAHRLSWALRFGDIPANMCVCHRCDVPACVNPAHLFLGTQLDNVRDMVQKKRVASGSNHYRSRLTDAQVLELRQLYSSGGWTHQAVAVRFGISKSQVDRILRRENWKGL